MSTKCIDLGVAANGLGRGSVCVDETTFQVLTLTVPTLVAVLLGYWCYQTFLDQEKIPRVDIGNRFAFSHHKARRAFVTHSRELLENARKRYAGQAFRIWTDVGEVVVLPPSVADEIRNEPKLSLAQAMYHDFHGDIRGFELTAIRDPNTHLVQTVTRKQLTKSLSSVVQPLHEETEHAWTLNLGNATDWTEVAIKPVILDVVARLSTRVFLGGELSRNPEWLRITKSYTVDMFIAATELRLWPRVIRPLVHWFLPKCTHLRAQFAEARRVIGSVIAERRRLQQTEEAAGRPPPRFDDALDWAQDEARAEGVSFDEAKFQLTMSVAAIHTTTDLLSQTILDLAQHPEILEPLRQEITQCVESSGWTKASLYNMKLLDSVIRESQRMKPSSIASMRRWVEQPLTLSNGLHLRRGMRINVDAYRMWDPTLYPEPQRWDGYRFLRMRDDDPARAQLVSTSPDHLAFGHGRHACPGRFFAAAEIKIALSHLLLHYDWELAPGTSVKPIYNGIAAVASPMAKLRVRRRTGV